MFRLVGAQENFADAIEALLELEYAAAGVYEAAIERLTDAAYKKYMVEFKKDHARHIESLSTLFEGIGRGIPEKKSSAKVLLTVGKVVFAHLMGDRAILLAIKKNEDDTNAAYARLQVHKNRWQKSEGIINSALEDEQKHIHWFKTVLSEQ